MNLVNSGRLQLPTAADRSRRVAPRCCVRSPASLLAVHKCRPELPTPSPTLHSPILSLSLSVKLSMAEASGSSIAAAAPPPQRASSNSSNLSSSQSCDGHAAPPPPSLLRPGSPPCLLSPWLPLPAVPSWHCLADALLLPAAWPAKARRSHGWPRPIPSASAPCLRRPLPAGRALRLLGWLLLCSCLLEEEEGRRARIRKKGGG